MGELSPHPQETIELSKVVSRSFASVTGAPSLLTPTTQAGGSAVIGHQSFLWGV